MNNTSKEKYIKKLIIMIHNNGYDYYINNKSFRIIDTKNHRIKNRIGWFCYPGNGRTLYDFEWQCHVIKEEYKKVTREILIEKGYKV